MGRTSGSVRPTRVGRRARAVPALTLIALLPLALSCDPDPTGPATADRQRTVLPSSEEEGPPRPHDFGPDTYRTGLFTGKGTTRPGLDCGSSGAAGRVCTGFLPSAVDGALLDVTVMVPHGTGPHPLVVLLHGWGGSKGSSSDIAGRLLGGRGGRSIARAARS